jgi:enediyne biosynthesis protein E4
MKLGSTAAFLGWALAAAALPAAAELRFVDVAEQAAVTTRTWCGREEKPHILESNGTGLALFDYDRDGDLDLYLVNGWRLEGSRIVEKGKDALYRNRGDGVFEEVSSAAGLGQEGWGSGVATGDMDGDGLIDLFVTNFGPDLLYRNRGDGTFERIEGGPGIDGWSTGAAFFDADGDGYQDLFVGGYIDSSLEEVLAARPTLYWEGLQVMLGPFGLEGLANRFWHNEGDGHYREATRDSGLEDEGLFYSFGILAADLDDDDDLDVYVANDSNPNYLYRNQGDGRCEEMGLWSGASLDAAGYAQAGMGVASGDVDQDGRLDLLVTNFWKDASTLYLNQGDLVFADATMAWGLHAPTYRPLSWGVTLADFDADGDLDVFIANGHIYPQADRAPTAETSFRQRNLLLENAGARFVDRTAVAGPGLEVEESSRGLAVGDWDGDGDLDLAVSNMDAAPTLLRNETEPAGRWLLVDAPAAAWMAIEAEGARQVRFWTAGGSYLSASDPRFHFGVGAASRIGSLRIRRRGAIQMLIHDLPVDHVLVFP